MDVVEAADAMITNRMKRVDVDAEMIIADVVISKKKLGTMDMRTNVIANFKFNIINKAADAASLSGYGFYPVIIIRIKNL